MAVYYTVPPRWQKKIVKFAQLCNTTWLYTVEGILILTIPYTALVRGWSQDKEIRFNEKMNPRCWGEVGGGGGEGEENDCVLIFY